MHSEKVRSSHILSFAALPTNWGISRALFVEDVGLISYVKLQGCLEAAKAGADKEVRILPSL